MVVRSVGSRRVLKSPTLTLVFCRIVLRRKFTKPSEYIKYYYQIIALSDRLNKNHHFYIFFYIFLYKYAEKTEFF